MVSEAMRVTMHDLECAAGSPQLPGVRRPVGALFCRDLAPPFSVEVIALTQAPWSPC